MVCRNQPKPCLKEREKVAKIKEKALEWQQLCHPWKRVARKANEE